MHIMHLEASCCMQDMHICCSNHAVCLQVPNIKFNVAKMLERLVPLVDAAVVQKTIKPCLLELQRDSDVDVRFFAGQALSSCDAVMAA